MARCLLDRLTTYPQVSGKAESHDAEWVFGKIVEAGAKTVVKTVAKNLFVRMQESHLADFRLGCFPTAKPTRMSGMDHLIHEQIERVFHQSSRQVFASLARLLRDLDLAEDAMQEAFTSAADQWPREGVPENPVAWLVSAGRFKAVDAIRLCRLVLELIEDAEVQGLLALMLLHESRRETRQTCEGDIILLEDQDRTRWNRELIDEGQRLIERLIELSLATRRFGVYTIQAAISAVHADAKVADDTDWNQIVSLFDLLIHMEQSADIELNRAVAMPKPLLRFRKLSR